MPAWLVAAGGGADAPTYLPYVVADPPNAGGFLFGYPLRAGHPQTPTNKILWATRLPRDGSQLSITAHPLNASGPVVSQTLPDDSSPGEIYPDILDVPEAGCWQLSLSWSGNHVQLELVYER